jgi:hypothetical protein
MGRRQANKNKELNLTRTSEGVAGGEIVSRISASEEYLQMPITRISEALIGD